MTRSSGTVVFRFNPQKREPPRRNGLGCHKTERPGLTAPCMIVVCRICHASPARGVFQTADGFGCIAPQYRCPWRAGAYRRDSPSSQWEAVVEVSLSPCGIIAPCMPPQGLWFTLIAPAAPSSRRTTSRSTAWFRTCDTRYSVVKIQSRKCIPSISGTFLRGKLHVASKLFQNFLHSAKSL